MAAVIATGSQGWALLGANRYTPAPASATFAKTQVSQAVPNPAPTAAAVRRLKPAPTVPRASMTPMVAVVPINPTCTIAHIYNGRVLNELSNPVCIYRTLGLFPNIVFN
jgi:hypothetical protein